ncbi:uncharacterized protein BXZ73DRAFT_108809 [Epithele typhae]|uniref:uncharacterized protein n=1 Tax=Epithele typhae TaxID=378194 RepID=UPI00200759D0|nr:uncharacterized protein BXZ73DRAFT_108809 [Epithele typhae]KAH9910551.1 hypothetical protein BXZ73DRAFT_108809 [Epithele typhae]
MAKPKLSRYNPSTCCPRLPSLCPPPRYWSLNAPKSPRTLHPEFSTPPLFPLPPSSSTSPSNARATVATESPSLSGENQTEDPTLESTQVSLEMDAATAVEHASDDEGEDEETDDDEEQRGSDGQPKKAKANNTIKPHQYTRAFEGCAPFAAKEMLRRHKWPLPTDECWGCQIIGRPPTILSDLNQRYKCEFMFTHAIVRWSPSDETWIPSSLQEATGEVIVLGHPNGKPCRNHTSSDAPVTIVHEGGASTSVKVKYCLCAHDHASMAKHRASLALRGGLWAGTWGDASPRTLYSLNLLHTLDARLKIAQTSMHDEFGVLRYLTDPVNPMGVKDRERQLTRTMRDFGYVKDCLDHGVIPLRLFAARSTDDPDPNPRIR